MILSKASPQTHLTEFFSVAFFPMSPRCLLQTSTTSGSNSNQSTKLKSLEMHSLATPPSPTPIIAALSLFSPLICFDYFTDLIIKKEKLMIY